MHSLSEDPLSDPELWLMELNWNSSQSWRQEKDTTKHLFYPTPLPFLMVQYLVIAWFVSLDHCRGSLTSWPEHLCQRKRPQTALLPWFLPSNQRNSEQDSEAPNHYHKMGRVLQTWPYACHLWSVACCLWLEACCWHLNICFFMETCSRWTPQRQPYKHFWRSCVEAKEKTEVQTPTHKQHPSAIHPVLYKYHSKLIKSESLMLNHICATRFWQRCVLTSSSF